MSAEATPAVRPRRSLLFMPGSNARALEKGREVAADGLIMDLEDAVAPDAKAAARTQVLAAIADGGYGGRELVIRVNGIGTEWFADDLRAVAKSGADAALIPKVADAATVAEADRLLAAAGAPDGLGIWCMIETAKGVLDARAIAAASARMQALIVGAADLGKDLRAADAPDRLALLTSISLIILAARAEGLAVLDSPFFDLSDDEGFARACAQGRTLGFDGKTLIHPKTIAAANAAYGPSAEDVARARRIIDAWSEAAADGKAVTLLDGRLVEGLHVEEARRLIALSETIDRLEREAAG